MNLTGNGVIAHDRTCYQLWEHRDVEQQIAEMPLYRGFTTIDINQIRDRLERIETDADRQGNFGVSHLDAKGVQLLGKETQIFESAQYQDVANQT